MKFSPEVGSAARVRGTGQPLTKVVALVVTAMAMLATLLAVTPGVSAAIDPKLGGLGDLVWIDSNANGVQDPGEPGIPNVTVSLFNTDTNQLLETAVTDADGFYLFVDLEVGLYTVAVDPATLPAGLMQTHDYSGPLDNMSITDVPEETYWYDQDFGYKYLLGEIGDTVWSDANSNGVQDNGEAGIPGATVLLRQNGNVIATTTTDGNGQYLFADLPAGNYAVQVVASSLPSGLAQTYDASGSLDNRSNVSLAPGESNLDQDFGYVELLGALGDTVWFDANSNGIQDNGEAGIPGATVLLRQNGAVINSTSTDVNGQYLFSDLPGGSYAVQVLASSLPSGLGQTYDASGSLDNRSAVNLAPGATNLDQDFGYVELLGAIGDTVWLDDNSNGAQDNGEAGIPGVTVYLRRAGSVIATTSTDANGEYLFDELPAGSYAVQVLRSSLPSGLSQTYDASGSLDNRSAVNLAPGETDLDQDFGYVALLGELGDTVWLDDNQNRIQDAGEAGIPNVTVLLRQGGVVIDTTTTDANGEYLFADLPGGNYAVQVLRSSLSSTLTQTHDFSGALDNRSVTSLASGGQDLDQDFGYVELLGNLGDTVWFDDNANRTQDAGEAGIPGVVVLLRQGGAVIDTTTTDANGEYLFADLPAGNYAVQVLASSLPAGVTQTHDDSGNLDNRSVTAVPAGGEDLDQDFGYRLLLGELGDTVWFDDNGNRTQDAGEAGIPGATVLLRQGGVVINSTTTDPNGEYLFTDLIEGNYAVQVLASTLPVGLVQTHDFVGGLDNRSVTFVPGGGQDLDQDFGYRQILGSLGDTVWLDDNNNRIQDAGEAGIPGVTVRLRQGGAVLETAVTDASGMYLFDGLPEGSYNVQVLASTLPADLVQTHDFTGNLDNQSVTFVPGGGEDLDQDFGYRPILGNLGDTVWFDDNGNRIQDAGEAGIPGVTVRLRQSGVVLDTTVTDANGMYMFTDLVEGTYNVQVAANTLPAGLTQTHDDSGSLDNQSVTFVPGGGEDLDQDFGYRELGSIGDLVWFDRNNNAIYDQVAGIEDEPFVGATVQLLVNGAVIATDTTDANGNYLFEDLPLGVTYTVKVDRSTLIGPGNPPNQTYDLVGDQNDDMSMATLGTVDPVNDLRHDFGYTYFED